VQFDEAQRASSGTAELEQPAAIELPSVTTEQVSTDLSFVAEAAELVGQEEALFKQRNGNRGPGGDHTGPTRDLDLGPSGPIGIIPRAERWAIRLQGSSPAEYAALLDFFHIELGALGGGSRMIQYASQFSSSKPVVRVGEPKDEHRLYMTWRSGELRARDEHLLSQAGVEVANKVLVQFYPSETEDRLAFLELEHAAGRPVAKIRRTTFGVRPNGALFEFFVISQTYR
jgi:hypothetical protein